MPKPGQAGAASLPPTIGVSGMTSSGTFRKGARAIMKANLPPSWKAIVGDELKKPYFKELSDFVDAERAAHKVFPPEDDVFNAFRYTPYDAMNVVLLGQDPYHDDNQAHGLC